MLLAIEATLSLLDTFSIRAPMLVTIALGYCLATSPRTKRLMLCTERTALENLVGATGAATRMRFAVATCRPLFYTAFVATPVFRAIAAVGADFRETARLATKMSLAIGAVVPPVLTIVIRTLVVLAIRTVRRLGKAAIFANASVCDAVLAGLCLAVRASGKLTSMAVAVIAVVRFPVGTLRIPATMVLATIPA
jgi:hypothetical protein